MIIVHEHSPFGAGLAKLPTRNCRTTVSRYWKRSPHPTPTREFKNVALKIKAQNPDIVIPANYYNEYVLLARTMQQQRVRPKGIDPALGALHVLKFVKEFP